MRILIGLGSNVSQGQQYIAQVLDELRLSLVHLQVSSIYPTAAFNQKADAHSYVNCVVEAESSLSQAELEAWFKGLEREYGRDEQARLTNSVPLDVDLILFDQLLLRPKELEAPYMQRGLEEIKFEL